VSIHEGIPEVYSAREIARAAGVSAGDVAALVESGQILTIDGKYVAEAEAIRAVQLLNGAAVRVTADRELFGERVRGRQNRGAPLLASSSLHAAMLALLAFISTLNLQGDADKKPVPLPTRMVFLATPGPGGGGGGGGLRQPKPAPKVELAGKKPFRSPVPVERAVRKAPTPEPVKRIPPPPPPRPEPVAKPVEPPPPVQKPDPIPPVVAPVVSSAADARDRAGVMTESASDANSHGPGTGGGAGTGRGTGMGEGDGNGIGPGSGGGTGGGPYRPGSGITPPSLVREVKPDYTEEARRRNLAGDVEMEIVVRADGSVGNVRLLRGLGFGLDQRAMDAVRQWKFAPATRHGTPVDVLVEVAVEFRLR
jgi:TonB family protein